MKKITKLLLITIIAAFINSCTTVQTLPEMQFGTLDGSTYSTSANNGDIIIYYFDPSCKHCRNSTTEISESSASFGDIDVLMISPHDRQSVTAYAQEHNLTGKDKLVVLLDSKGHIQRRYKPGGYPMYYLYRGNKLIQSFQGVTGVEELKNAFVQ
jgi:peroxiredoxin